MVSDDKLILQCIGGVLEAERQLYDLYKTKWFMICLRYVKHRENALDVLQNALIKIFSKLNTYNSELGSFANWSSKIVVNESIMYQRKFWRGSEMLELHEELFVESSDSKPLGNLSVQELMKLIQMLPDGYRTVFNMYAIEGYSHNEIANILGISEGTSKSQLFKARRILKKQLEVIF